MNKFRLGAVMALLVIVVCAIAGCGTSTVSVADVTYKDMPLQIHNEANVTALNKGKPLHLLCQVRYVRML